MKGGRTKKPEALALSAVALLAMGFVLGEVMPFPSFVQGLRLSECGTMQGSTFSVIKF